MRSIRFRLAVWYTAVLAAGLILFSGTVWFALRHLLLADLNTSVQNQMKGFEKYMRIEAQDELPGFLHELDEYSSSMPFVHLIFVRDPTGALLYRNPVPLDTTALNRASSLPLGAAHELLWNRQPYCGVRWITRLNNRSYSVFLAVPSGSVHRTIQLLGALLLGLVPVFVMGGAAGGYWLSRRALAPVDRITDKVRTIGVENLSERLSVPATGDELQRLAETWNETLSRLESAVSKISQFTADASHELRTPVAIIRLAAEQALRKPRSDVEYRATLERIQNQSENMTRLIESLLFLARSDLDLSAPQQREWVDIPALVEELFRDFERLAAAKNIHLKAELPSFPALVPGSAPGIRQMFTVLLDNALKYTPEGGRVTVRVEQNGPLVIVSVDDTGIGIPEYARPYIFERFFRVDASRNKASGGFGLGLSIARRIAEQNNATIELVAKEAGGCRFSISLPLAT